MVLILIAHRACLLAVLCATLCSGLLPEGLAFWAVANPLTEAGEAGVDRLRRKVQLGAEVILTQPPLAWQPFER